MSNLAKKMRDENDKKILQQAFGRTDLASSAGSPKSINFLYDSASLFIISSNICNASGFVLTLFGTT